MQILDNQTKEIINTANLDQELINFGSVFFTTSSCDFIVTTDSHSDGTGIPTGESVKRVLSLVSELQKSYPPEPNTDISGLEEIYE